MRLFVALDIAAEIRDRIAQFVADTRKLASEARWVNPAAFHVTLKFIGEKSPEAMEEIKRALAGIQSPQTSIAFSATGFFPNPRAARVFWAGMAADANLAALAAKVDEVLSNLKIPPEEHAFTPHLTLARGGDRRHPRGGSGRPQWQAGDGPQAHFHRLQEHLAASPAPDFGAMTATEFFLFESKLSPRGAQYVKLASYPLQAT
jgi:2'-5' RNA ligase